MVSAGMSIPLGRTNEFSMYLMRNLCKHNYEYNINERSPARGDLIVRGRRRLGDVVPERHLGQHVAQSGDAHQQLHRMAVHQPRRLFRREEVVDVLTSRQGGGAGVQEAEVPAVAGIAFCVHRLEILA